MSNSQGSLTFDVLIQRPQAHHNKYVYDERHRAIRLEQVVYSRERLPADWGTILKTIGDDSSPLEALVLVTQPTFDGCLIDCRAIGGLEIRHSTWVSYKIIAVPTTDPYFSNVRSVAALPSGRKEQIEAFFGQEEDAVKVTFAWHSAEVAERMVSAALRAARMLETESRPPSGPPPAWKASSITPVATALAPDAWIKETDAFTHAERSLRKMPYRFQTYLDDCLLPEERVLLWVYRPRMAAPASGWRLLPRKQLLDGFLVVTDQQVLMIVDAIPPDATMIHWGYVARASAVERVCRVETATFSGGVRLALTFGSASGVETFAVEFPERVAPYVEEAAGILQQFVPVEGDRRLRRLLEDIVTEGEDEEEGLASAAPTSLHDKVEAALAAGEQVIAQAFIPANAEERRELKLVATTRERVLVGDPSAPSSLREYQIANISSLELRHCQLGCWFELAMPNKGSVERIRVDYQSPISPQFVKTFRIIRQLLSNPIAKPQIKKEKP